MRLFTPKPLLGLLCLASLFVADSAFSDEWKSPKGFTLTYPPGWTMATAEQIQAAAGNAGANAKPGKGAEGPTIDAVLLGPSKDNFTPHLNIVVLPEVTELNAKNEALFFDRAKKWQGDGQPSTPTLTTSHIKVDGRPAFAVTGDKTVAKSGEAIRACLICISGAKQTYIITCTAKDSQWKDTAKDFKKIVGDLRVDVEDKP